MDELSIEPGEVGDAWERFDEFLRRHERRTSVGYLGFDLGDAVEPLRGGRRIDDDLPIPVLRFAAYDRCEEWPREELARSVSSVVGPPPAARSRSSAVGAGDSVSAHIDRAGYEARVARVIEHIRQGDIFQANMTQPFSGAFDGDPRELFGSLCEVSPAPFATYLESGTGPAIVSSSPEEYLAVDPDGSVRTRPIKGTRPRGRTPFEDARQLTELMTSEKDLAELAMIVDLMRNDLGKVAEVGSVAVGPFPEHASFAQVHHLFATVTAQLRGDRTLVDLLRATFPAGSITGAPKLRCMEIIEDLELVRRGVYTGALGWIGPGPQMHLNVAIRTMTVSDGRVRLNAGGGITADSDPAAEYVETLHKASGMLRALGLELEDLT